MAVTVSPLSGLRALMDWPAAPDSSGKRVVEITMPCMVQNGERRVALKHHVAILDGGVGDGKARHNSAARVFAVDLAGLLHEAGKHPGVSGEALFGQM